MEKLMDKDTVDKMLCKIKQDGITSIGRVILFGGEPFLNLSIFSYIIEEIRKFATIRDVETVTNVTILNDRVKNMIELYQPNITISLDGPQKIHDKMRGRHSFEKTIKFINYLKDIAYPNMIINSTYTLQHQKMGFKKSDIEIFLENLDIRYNIADVFSENKLLALTYQEKSYEENKTFVDDSFDIVLNNEYKQYISPILYDALMSLIFKTSIKHFCDDIMPENGMAIDVTGKNYRCFRFWGKDLTDKEIDFHNAKESIDLCKNCEFKGMCMECTANKIDGYKTKLRTAINSTICDKQKLFEYIIERIVLLSKDQNKLKCLVNNFPNFIQYA